MIDDKCSPSLSFFRGAVEEAISDILDEVGNVRVLEFRWELIPRSPSLVWRNVALNGHATQPPLPTNRHKYISYHTI